MVDQMKCQSYFYSLNEPINYCYIHCVNSKMKNFDPGQNFYDDILGILWEAILILTLNYKHYNEIFIVPEFINFLRFMIGISSSL